MTDFEKLLRALADAGVDYIIVGGFAGTLHGSSIPTRDLDIVYDRSEANIERLVAALAPYSPCLRGAPEGLPFRWDADTVRRGLNFTLTTDLGARAKEGCPELLHARYGWQALSIRALAIVEGKGRSAGGCPRPIQPEAVISGSPRLLGGLAGTHVESPIPAESSTRVYGPPPLA